MENIRESILILWSTPVYLVLIAMEIIFSNARTSSFYSIRNTIENIYLSLINASIDLGIRAFVLFTLGYWFQHKLVSINNTAIYWIALMVGLDFMFYLLHLVDHKCRLFWAIHVTHHSSEEFNLTVGFRSSVFQPLYRFLYFMPLAWIGFQPIDILFIYSASQIYGIILHTRYVKNLGWLEWILVTPSHHRVHHGSNQLYLDKNMGMVFIIWDRLFGTFQPETEEVQYGITKPLRNHHPITVLFHEWHSMIQDCQQAGTFRAKLKIILGKPR